jgi:sulfane dehydrogenase subunit SoxC
MGEKGMNEKELNAKKRGRRRFLKEGAALAGLAVGGMKFESVQTLKAEPTDAGFKDTRAYGERSHYETSSRWPIRPAAIQPGAPQYLIFAPSRTPLQDLKGIITPSPLHYFVDSSAAYPIVDIDPAQHSLVIHGMVGRPLIFTLEELKNLPSVSRIIYLECAGNSNPRERNFMEYHETVQMVHGSTSCSEWTGVPLSLLLKEAGLQKGASWIFSEGAERARKQKSLQLEKAMDDVMVAYAQNGEAPRPENGYPLRLIVPGRAGHNNIKWLRRIKVMDRPLISKDDTGFTNVDGKWTGEYDYTPKSIITRPSGGQTLPGRGWYEISGLAWTGGGVVVKRVEVTTDGGKTWKDAELQEPVLPRAHTRFRLPWIWDGAETVIEARCTDAKGLVQPRIAEIRAKYGDNPDNWRAIPDVAGSRFNGTQPWLVTHEGKVHNAAHGPHMTPPPAPGTPADTAANFDPGRRRWSC